MINEPKKFLDSDTLKMIAVGTMLIDHIGAALLRPVLPLAAAEGHEMWYGIYHILRNVGRTAFPIFAFLLVEGFFHTHNRKRYFGRLFLFAMLSEIPFDLAFHGTLFYPEDQNVFWTLSLGFCAIWGLENLCEVYRAGSGIIKANEGKGEAGYSGGFIILAVGLVLAGASMAVFLRADYKVYGFLLILLFYLGKHAALLRVLICIGGYLLFLWEPYCLGGFLLILFYDGTRRPRGKGFQYFFYLFYPVHLLILGLVRMVMAPG